LILFEEALRLISENTHVLPATERDIFDLDQEVLAEDVQAQKDIPFFSNSAMDGYALRSDDTLNAPVVLTVKGFIQAGDSSSMEVGKGEAVKIMTGAPLVEGADAVVMVEDTEEQEQKVLVKKVVKKGEHVRLQGEEIKKDQIGLKKGTPLNPASVGFLASMGRQKVQVYGKPRISILMTGNELISPGKELKKGQIWESNSYVLTTALRELGINPIVLGNARDDLQDIKERIQSGLDRADVLLIAGGISVGDYDFVQEAVLGLGVKKIFWRVAVKPGKPTFFGIKGKKLIFGLPGNPASILVTYLAYVRPAVLKMMGHHRVYLSEVEAILEEELKKKTDRVNFLRGVFREQNGRIYVKTAGFQNSYMLESFAKANCLIFLEKEKNIFFPGEKVKIQILPWKV
jgi:molybdopterin molybdotransferase